MAYLLLFYFWSNGHVAKLEIHNKDYSSCIVAAEQLSKDIAATWVCIPDSN